MLKIRNCSVQLKQPAGNKFQFYLNKGLIEGVMQKELVALNKKTGKVRIKKLTLELGTIPAKNPVNDFKQQLKAATGELREKLRELKFEDVESVGSDGLEKNQKTGNNAGNHLSKRRTELSRLILLLGELHGHAPRAWNRLLREQYEQQYKRPLSRQTLILLDRLIEELTVTQGQTAREHHEISPAKPLSYLLTGPERLAVQKLLVRLTANTFFTPREATAPGGLSSTKTAHVTGQSFELNEEIAKVIALLVKLAGEPIVQWHKLLAKQYEKQHQRPLSAITSQLLQKIIQDIDSEMSTIQVDETISLLQAESAKIPVQKAEKVGFHPQATFVVKLIKQRPGTHWKTLVSKLEKQFGENVSVSLLSTLEPFYQKLEVRKNTDPHSVKTPLSKQEQGETIELIHKLSVDGPNPEQASARKRLNLLLEKLWQAQPEEWYSQIRHYYQKQYKKAIPKAIRFMLIEFTVALKSIPNEPKKEELSGSQNRPKTEKLLWTDLQSSLKQETEEALQKSLSDHESSAETKKVWINFIIDFLVNTRFDLSIISQLESAFKKTFLRPLPFNLTAALKSAWVGHDLSMAHVRPTAVTALVDFLEKAILKESAQQEQFDQQWVWLIQLVKEQPPSTGAFDAPKLIDAFKARYKEELLPELSELLRSHYQHTIAGTETSEKTRTEQWLRPLKADWNHQKQDIEEEIHALDFLLEILAENGSELDIEKWKRKFQRAHGKPLPLAIEKLLTAHITEPKQSRDIAKDQNMSTARSARLSDWINSQLAMERNAGETNSGKTAVLEFQRLQILVQEHWAELNQNWLWQLISAYQIRHSKALSNEVIARLMDLLKAPGLSAEKAKKQLKRQVIEVREIREKQAALLRTDASKLLDFLVDFYSGRPVEKSEKQALIDQFRLQFGVVPPAQLLEKLASLLSEKPQTEALVASGGSMRTLSKKDLIGQLHSMLKRVNGASSQKGAEDFNEELGHLIDWIDRQKLSAEDLAFDQLILRYQRQQGSLSDGSKKALDEFRQQLVALSEISREQLSNNNHGILARLSLAMEEVDQALRQFDQGRKELEDFLFKAFQIENDQAFSLPKLKRAYETQFSTRLPEPILKFLIEKNELHGSKRKVREGKTHQTGKLLEWITSEISIATQKVKKAPGIGAMHQLHELQQLRQLIMENEQSPCVASYPQLLSLYQSTFGQAITLHSQGLLKASMDKMDLQRGSEDKKRKQALFELTDAVKKEERKKLLKEEKALLQLLAFITARATDFEPIERLIETYQQYSQKRLPQHLISRLMNLSKLKSSDSKPPPLLEYLKNEKKAQGDTVAKHPARRLAVYRELLEWVKKQPGLLENGGIKGLYTAFEEQAQSKLPKDILQEIKALVDEEVIRPEKINHLIRVLHAFTRPPLEADNAAKSLANQEIKTSADFLIDLIDQKPLTSSWSTQLAEAHLGHFGKAIPDEIQKALNTPGTSSKPLTHALNNQPQSKSSHPARNNRLAISSRREKLSTSEALIRLKLKKALEKEAGLIPAAEKSYEIKGAGFVIGWPLFKRFFDDFNWLRAGQLNWKEEATDHSRKAANWLQRLSGKEIEQIDPLVNLLCDREPHYEDPLTDDELPPAMTGQNLEASLLEFRKTLLILWPVFKPDQLDEFTELFLQREGLLYKDKTGWHLEFVTAAYDQVLMEKQPIPWPLNAIQLPWSSFNLNVRWQ